MSLLVTFEALFDLETIVIQAGLKQLGVDNNATFDYLELESLSKKANNERSFSLHCGLGAFCLRFGVV